jgi:phosphoglycerate dehydrogenase-like enzyme
MNNSNQETYLRHKTYILTDSDAQYSQLLTGHDLTGLAITDNRAEATILLADPPLAAKQLDDFPKLQWLQSTFAGVDALMADGLRQDYQLTNVKGIFGQLIAEYVLGYSIDFYRHLSVYREQQRQKVWQPRPYHSLAGKTMVILGTGAIGSHLAHVARQFGMTVYGVNRTGIPPTINAFDKTFHVSELSAAFAVADIVVSTLPNTPDTAGILNAESVACCQNILLFNVGRGKNLAEADVIALIESGHVQHAFLDVFHSEPLSKTHPFWSHEQITVTPHIAAVSFPEQVVDIFADNYMRWIRGIDLAHLIDFTKGY